MPNRMASPSDSVMNQFLMSMMNPSTMQRTAPVSGGQRRVIEEAPKAPTPTIFDQSQQPVLGGLARRPQMGNAPPVMQEEFPRLPSQLISPSPELVAKLLAQVMFSGRR